MLSWLISGNAVIFSFSGTLGLRVNVGFEHELNRCTYAGKLQ